MRFDRRKHALKSILLTTVVAFGSASAPAFAQGAETATPHRQIDGEKILQLLVAKGVVSQADADSIEAQATVVPAAPAAVAGGVDGDVQTIPYIPETVKTQIKEELRTEMANQAVAQGWAKPGVIPEWTNRITISGDLRIREEADLFDKNNDPSIPNFAAMNAGSPYNINRAVAGSVNPPFLDTTENRNRTRIRARLDVVARPDDWITVDIRAATGNDSSPVSPNQTLGAGGDFSKYAIWLDRADLELTPHGKLEGLRVDLGRGESPFWSTPLLFYPDLAFDGFYARYRHGLGTNSSVFATAGAFPIFNTDLNFGSRDIGAFKSRDKWMFGGQFGVIANAGDAFKLTTAAAFFDFQGIQGKVSSPCNFDQDVCDTDPTRPQFQQYGNSMMPIRDIIADPTAAPGLSTDPQYFGLASAFRVLDIHAAVDIAAFPKVPVRIEGDYIENTAFNKAKVLARQVNVGTGSYDPGAMGWYGNLTVGKPDIKNFGDWNFSVGYRYIESDAMVDGLADADFHLGGTNAKGYTLMGYFGIGHNTSVGARWFSADSITGLPYSNDVFQFDINTRF